MGKMGMQFPAPKKQIKGGGEPVDVPVKDKQKAARGKK